MKQSKNKNKKTPKQNKKNKTQETKLMPRETNRGKRDNCTETKTDKMTDKRKQRKAKDIGSNIYGNPEGTKHTKVKVANGPRMTKQWFAN